MVAGGTALSYLMSDISQLVDLLRKTVSQKRDIYGLSDCHTVRYNISAAFGARLFCCWWCRT